MTFMASASAAASRAVIEHGSGWLTAKLAAVRQRRNRKLIGDPRSAYRRRPEVAGRLSKRRFLTHSGHSRGEAYPSIKNAIGTLGRWLSELDISRSRLTVLS